MKLTKNKTKQKTTLGGASQSLDGCKEKTKRVRLFFMCQPTNIVVD